MRVTYLVKGRPQLRVFVCIGCGMAGSVVGMSLHTPDPFEKGRSRLRVFVCINCCMAGSMVGDMWCGSHPLLKGVARSAGV